LTVSELLKIHKENYLKLCNNSGKPPDRQIIKRFRSEMRHLKNAYDQTKNKYEDNNGNNKQG
jgi:hypothetical protein